MEIEYKWELPDEDVLAELLGDDELAPMLGEPCMLRMRAIYYDTVAEDVRRMRGGLRIRQENDESVCCLKLAAQASGACKARQEFEVAADDIIDGLGMLPRCRRSGGRMRDVARGKAAADVRDRFHAA